MGKVFISYSHLNEGWKKRVAAHLGVLANPHQFEVWDDSRIKAGAPWETEIEAAMASCRVALLLVSTDFLNSHFILKREIPKLLERRQKEGLRVIPVILKPCAWDEIPWLARLQARSKWAAPLSGMSEHDADAALTELAKEVKRLAATNGTTVEDDQPTIAPPTDRIFTTKLPTFDGRLIGRDAELAMLDEAWAGDTRVVVLEALGVMARRRSLVVRWGRGGDDAEAR